MKKYVAIFKDNISGDIFPGSKLFESEGNVREHYKQLLSPNSTDMIAVAEIKWAEQVMKWKWVALDTHNEYFITNGYYVGKCEYNAKGWSKKNIAFVQKVEGSEKMMNPDEN